MQNNKGQKRSIGSLLSLIFVLAVVAAIAIYFLVVLIRAASGAGTVSEYLNNLMPNVVRTRREFWKSLKQTLQMVGYSSLFSASFGIFFGVILVVTQKGGILESRPIFQLLDQADQLLPFDSLHYISGASDPHHAQAGRNLHRREGRNLPAGRGHGAVLLKADSRGAVRGGRRHGGSRRAMGLSPASIILRVYLREGLPGMIRGATITIVNIIALTAMAGTVGSGGLGDYAIRYGYQRVMTDVTVVTIIVVLLMVTIIQTLGTFLERVTTH